MVSGIVAASERRLILCIVSLQMIEQQTFLSFLVNHLVTTIKSCATYQAGPGIKLKLFILMTL